MACWIQTGVMVELCSSLASGGTHPRPQQRHRRVSPVSTPVSRSPFSAPLSQKSRALHLARAQQFAPARQAFQTLLAESPDDVKAWISWAQVCGSASLATLMKECLKMSMLENASRMQTRA